VPGALASHVAFRELVQLLIHQGSDFVESLFVPGSPGFEELSYLMGSGQGHLPPSRPVAATNYNENVKLSSLAPSLLSAFLNAVFLRPMHFFATEFPP